MGVSDSVSTIYLFDEYRLDVSRRMLYCGEREVVLPLKAIETLIALIELRGEIVSKGDLMQIIWGDTICRGVVYECKCDGLRSEINVRCGSTNSWQFPDHDETLAGLTDPFPRSISAQVPSNAIELRL